MQEVLERHARVAPSYWLQLLLSMALSTLGLVLGSTGVVSGAMLIAPLMEPLVDLGMGFAAGSPLLTLRSLVRVAVSVVVVVARAARWLEGVFGSAYGPLLRVLLPAALVAAVSVPLLKALREVSWQVQVRSQVRRLLGQVAPAQSTVRTDLTVDRQGVRAQLVVVGSPEAALALERQLAERIRQETGATASVSVLAVPDVETMRQVAGAIRLRCSCRRWRRGSRMRCAGSGWCRRRGSSSAGAWT